MNPNAGSFVPAFQYPANPEDMVYYYPQGYAPAQMYPYQYASGANPAQKKQQKNGSKGGPPKGTAADADDAVSPLQLLQLMFGDMFSHDHLLAELEAVHYDVEAIVARLLSQTQTPGMSNGMSSLNGEGGLMNFNGTSASFVPSVQQPHKKVSSGDASDIVCKYYLRGTCKVSNCPFRHTTQVACKYWLRDGFCMRGDRCHYVHTYDVDAQSLVQAKHLVEQAKERGEQERGGWAAAAASGQKHHHRGGGGGGGGGDGKHAGGNSSGRGHAANNNHGAGSGGQSNQRRRGGGRDRGVVVASDQEKDVSELKAAADELAERPVPVPHNAGVISFAAAAAAGGVKAALVKKEAPVRPQPTSTEPPAASSSSSATAYASPSSSTSTTSSTGAGAASGTSTTNSPLNRKQAQKKAAKVLADAGFRGVEADAALARHDNDAEAALKSLRLLASLNVDDFHGQQEGDSGRLATRLRAKALQAQFPAAPPALVTLVLSELGSSDAATHWLDRTFNPKAAAAAAAAAAEATAVAEAAEAVPSSGLKPAPVPAPAAKANATATPAPATGKSGSPSWVSTGSDVGELYTRHRDQGIAHAQQRNRLFALATKAFLRGDGKGARDLSRQGRQHHVQMEAAHQAAADAIFGARNQPGSGVLDLHGLHVKEALGKLERAMDGGEFVRGRLYVITGTGHHSEENALNTARLMPKVQQFLQKRKIFFEDVSTDQRGGMLCIKKSP